MCLDHQYHQKDWGGKFSVSRPSNRQPGQKHEQPGQTKGLGSLYSYCTVTRNFGVYVKMPKDHSSYFWGLYVNPNDERTFVPKAGQTTYFPLGATINLSHTEGKLFMTALGTVLAWSFFGMYRDSRR
jgi:hypothetical protein